MKNNNVLKNNGLHNPDISSDFCEKWLYPARKRYFKADFERKLLKLNHSLTTYFATGKLGNLLPHLFSVYSAVWFHDVYLKKPVDAYPDIFDCSVTEKYKSILY